MNRGPLFVDASAWVALVDASDGLHQEARSFWEEARIKRRTFLTTDYVLDETYTFLRRRRNGLSMAKSIHEMVEASRLIEIAEVDPDLQQHAWEIFVGYEDKILSFTDCTSFALLRERRFLEAFTFDRDFERAGFVCRPWSATG